MSLYESNGEFKAFPGEAPRHEEVVFAPEYLTRSDLGLPLKPEHVTVREWTLVPPEAKK